MREMGKSAVVAAMMLASPAWADDRSDVAAVLKQYQSAIERLDAAAATPLFTADARIFEQGGDEGTWTTYLTHHLKPELAEFSRFTFSNYAVDVDVAIFGDLAVASERYRYDIVLKKDGAQLSRLGVATSVLKRTPQGWRILQHHSSSRKPPEPGKP
jgi:uncharacterized protein (TIGR02246 family)